jgi:hypothetical protein
MPEADRDTPSTGSADDSGAISLSVANLQVTGISNGGLGIEDSHIMSATADTRIDLAAFPTPHAGNAAMTTSIALSPSPVASAHSDRSTQVLRNSEPDSTLMLSDTAIQIGEEAPSTSARWQVRRI